MFAAAYQHLWNFAACASGSGFLGFPTWYKYLDSEDVAGKCTPKIDFSQPSQLASILLALVEILLRIGGLVAVGFVIYGGFKYIMSQGDSDKAANARRTVLNAVIGMIIAMLATAIVNLLAGSLT